MNKKSGRPRLGRIVTSLTLTAVMILGTMLPAAAAQSEQKEQTKSRISIGTVDFGQVTPSGYLPVNTHLPDPVLISPMADSYPEKFDLRTTNRVTPVRDQNPNGTCWAFGALGSAESSMLSQGFGAKEFSVRHLTYFSYNNNGDSFYTASGNDLMSGGNDYIATGTLARWSGAQLEENAPYPHKQVTSANYNTDYALPASQKTASYAHLQNAYFLDSADTLGIKQLLTEKGAVDISYWAEDSISGDVGSYYDLKNNAYYTGDDQGRLPNHTVLIVGWDDNFAVSNFSSTARPSRPGAWLIKNSWGSDWGDGGYFWMSYEEPTLDMATYYDMEPVSNYQKNYQYDEAGWTNYFEVTGATLMANVYTAQQDETLEAVSFYTLNYDNWYAIQVVTGLTDDNNPQSGIYELNEDTIPKGSLHQPGYHTIKLSAPVRLKAGEKFSIMIMLQSLADEVTYVAMEQTIDQGDIRFRTESKAGQSFVLEYENWLDTKVAFGQEGIGNLCIKAFTNTLTPADKTALNTAIQRAESHTHSEYYQTEAWNTMKASLTEAKSVAADESLLSKDQQTVDAAAKKLTDALDALDKALALANKTALKTALDAAAEKQKELSYYANWDSVVKAPLTAAQNLYKDETLTLKNDQSRVDAAATALTEALAKLTYKPADKSALKTAIDTNTGKQETLYTEGSWAVFQTALTAANTLYSNNSLNIKDQQTIDAAASALLSAAAGLTLKPADKSTLEALVKQAEVYEDRTDLYTKASLDLLTAKANAARELLKEELTASDEARIRKASNELDAAIQALIYLPADTAALSQKLTQARTLLEEAKASGNYTDASVAVLETAVADADKLLNKQGLNITDQPQINAMTDTLANAVKLELKPADKAALRAKAEEVKSFVEAEYQSGWNSFAAALTQANKLLADTSLTILDQLRIDNALTALADAVGKLVLKPADTTALQEKVNEVKSLKKDNYQSGWDAFAAALAEANKLLTNPSLTIRDQPAVNNALSSLNETSGKLILKAADTAALADKADTAKKLIKENYQSGWEEVETALKEATLLLSNQSLTILDQKKVDEALTALNSALLKLVAKPADKAALTTLVNEVKNLIENDYQTGWADFSKALTDAQKILADASLTILDQPRIDAACETLRNAAGKLILKAADKKALQAKISLVKDLKENNYTSGWADFAKALEAANKILTDGSLTIYDQAKVAEALKALNEATDALILKAVDVEALQKLIEENTRPSYPYYTNETLAIFEDAMDAAKEAVRTAQTILDQPLVDAAYDALVNAILGLRVYATQDDVTVTLPDGKVNLEEHKLQVETVIDQEVLNQAAQALGFDVNRLTAMTLSFVDAEGNTVVPESGWGNLTVSLPLPEGYLSDRIAVYALDAEGNAVLLNSQVQNGKIEVQAGRLGTLVIAEKKEEVKPDPENPSSTPDAPSEGTKPTTGDGSVAAVGALCTLSAAALLLLSKTRRKHNSK